MADSISKPAHLEIVRMNNDSLLSDGIWVRACYQSGSEEFKTLKDANAPAFTNTPYHNRKCLLVRGDISKTVTVDEENGSESYSVEISLSRHTSDSLPEALHDLAKQIASDGFKFLQNQANLWLQSGENSLEYREPQVLNQLPALQDIEWLYHRSQESAYVRCFRSDRFDSEAHNFLYNSTKSCAFLTERDTALFSADETTAAKYLFADTWAEPLFDSSRVYLSPQGKRKYQMEFLYSLREVAEKLYQTVYPPQPTPTTLPSIP